MRRVVCLDSQVVVWGVKKQCRPGQEQMIVKAEWLIKELEEQKAIAIIPAPAMAELLSPLNDDEANDFMDLVKDVFRVPSFDMAAARMCAKLFTERNRDPSIRVYRKEREITRETMKFDLQIVSIAIVNGCDCIYSEDPDIAKFAGTAIKVLTVPPVYVQGQMDLE